MGRGKRRGGGRGTDFSFKAKGELCQLTASACAGPLTQEWEQTAAGTLQGRSRELTSEPPPLLAFYDPENVTSLWVLYFVLPGDTALPYLFSLALHGSLQP